MTSDHDVNVAFGYAENLPVDDPRAIVERIVPVPEPGPHDLLVRVHAVSINPAEVKTRASTPTDDFRILGFDGAGVVEAVGNAVTLFAPGDRVFYAGSIDRPGSEQRLQLVDERVVGHAPAAVSDADAASLPLTALTAWEAAFDRLRLDADSEGTLLVVGATGGVGSILIQLVRVRSPQVQVIATASGSEGRDWVTRMGAQAIVDHHGDLAAQVSDEAPGGVDWLFTAHSDGQIELYAEIVRPYGEIVAIDDGPRDVAALKPKSIAWHWEFMFTAPLSDPESAHQHDILDEVAALVDSGRIVPTTGRVLSPISADAIREGHRLVESGRAIGKVVVADHA